MDCYTRLRYDERRRAVREGTTAERTSRRYRRAVQSVRGEYGEWRCLLAIVAAKAVHWSGTGLLEAEMKFLTVNDFRKLGI